MQWLQTVGEFIYNFLVVGVIGYIAKRWVADKLMEKGKIWINKNERNIAIWTHYNAKAAGHGHDTDSVLDCDDQRCIVFKSYAS